MDSSENLSSFTIKGIITAPFTPMKENGDIDVDALDKYVDHIRKHGILNVYVNGTTGEGLSMTVEERKIMAEAWMKACKGKMRCVIVHVGCGNQRESIDLARHAQSIGAHAIAAICPTFYKPASEEVVVEYMKPIAAAAPNTPFYYYGISHMTGLSLKNSKICELSKDKIPTFRGLKHSCKGLPSMLLCGMVDENIQVIAGTDEQYLAALAMGAEYSVVQSFMGAVTNRIRDAFLAGDMETARKWQEKGNIMSEIRLKHGGGQAITKTILALTGLDLGPTRLPLAMPSSDKKAQLKEDLTRAGFFEWTQPTAAETSKWLSQFDS